MVALSRCLGSLALLASGADAARISRKKAEKVQDCYSTYDGKALLRLNTCTAAEAGDILAQLHEKGCTVVDEEDEMTQRGCDGAEAVCSQEAAAALSKISSIVSSDAGALWRNTSGTAQPFTEGLGVASDFYSNWRDLSARMARVESLVANANAAGVTIEIKTVGQSLQGRDMKTVTLTGANWVADEEASKRVFVTFNIHAREWIAGMSGVYHLEELIKKVEADPSYLDKTQVVLMPMANPDGFVYSTTNTRMHRKNMKDVGRGCLGVDLNRNYDAQWASGGSSGSPCSDTYHGTSANSEPETKVIAAIMTESKLDVYIDVHAYSELIISAWGYTRANNPRAAEYRNIGGMIVDAIQGSGGKRWTEGPIAQVLYAASGSTNDYAQIKAGALGVCFELRPGRYGGGGFAPAPDQILPGAKECHAGLLAVIDYAKNPPATTTPAPTPPGAGCNPAFSTGPDGDGDCSCNSGLTCFEGGSRGCTYSYTARYGWTSTRYFLPTCSACACQ